MLWDSSKEYYMRLVDRLHCPCVNEHTGGDDEPYLYEWIVTAINPSHPTTRLRVRTCYQCGRSFILYDADKELWYLMTE